LDKQILYIKLKHYQIYLFSVLVILFTSHVSMAEKRVARINENDSQTNIYGGQGINYYIVGTINSEDLFFCETAKNDWYKVTVLKWTDKGEQIEGYILKDLVEFLDELPELDKKELLLVTFEKQIEMAFRFQKSDSLSRQITKEILETHTKTKYIPIASLFPSYFCKSDDSVALAFFLETVLSDNGSSSNMTYSYLSDCYLCNSDVILRQLNVISRKNQRQLIIDNIVKGLKSHYKIQDIVFEKQENQTKKNYIEFSKLVKKLEVVYQ